jgi:hypothetical protein
MISAEAELQRHGDHRLSRSFLDDPDNLIDCSQSNPIEKALTIFGSSC